MSRKSSDCYVLEKCIDKEFRHYSVIFFHTVVNGNRYIERTEYFNPCHSHKDRRSFVARDRIRPNYHLSVAEGNKRYLEYIDAGYTLVGKYEMDILGRLKGNGIYDSEYQDKLRAEER